MQVQNENLAIYLAASLKLISKGRGILARKLMKPTQFLQTI